MRLQLNVHRSSGARAVLVAAVLVATMPLSAVRADDHVTVRGAYYREASTRVIQPVVEISKDLPRGFDITAHYLLDAITSASVAAGTSADTIFTEMRNEVGLALGKSWDRWRATMAYQYSAESDYWSHGVSGSAAYRFWGDSATLAASGGAAFDGAWPRARTPDCPTAAELICKLRTYFGSLSYTQVATPTLLFQVGVEGAFLDGFQASLYRAVPNLGYEKVPLKRWRGVITARTAYYIPSSRTGLQLHYRFYRDEWELTGHMIEPRVYQGLTRDLELRASYRYYTQTSAYFWCDWMARPDCYGPSAQFYTGDPKLQPVHTSMPELKLTWDAFRWRGVPFFGWFSEGAFEISYAYLIQNTSFGNAHLIQMGYTLPY